MKLKAPYKVGLLIAGLTVLIYAAFVGARIIEYTNGSFSGLTPGLTEAISADDTMALRILLLLGANPHGTPETQSPVHHAAASGRVKAMRVLLGAGADPNAASFGQTPLMAAALGRQDDAVRVLETRGAQRGFAEMVFLGDEVGARRALADEPDLLETERVFGAPLLYTAVEYRHLDGARLLLRLGASPSQLGRGGQSAMELVRTRNDEAWIALFEDLETTAKPKE